MPIPVKFTSPAPLQGLGRSGDGRFQSLRPPSPTALDRDSKDRGEPLQQVAQAARVPGRDVPASAPTTGAAGTTPTYREALPWPEVEGRLPVRFTGG